MALAVNGSGTIFKKCDRSNHRPDSNKGCASATCQHTCDPGALPARLDAALLGQRQAGREVVQGQAAPQRGAWTTEAARSSRGTRSLSSPSISGQATSPSRVTARPASRTSARRASRSYHVCRSATTAVPVPDSVPDVRRGCVRRHDAGSGGATTGRRDRASDRHHEAPQQHASPASAPVIVGTCDEAVKAGRLSRHRLDDIALADHRPRTPLRFRLPELRASQVRCGRRVQPGHQARGGRCGTLRLAHAGLWPADRRGACGVQGRLH